VARLRRATPLGGGCGVAIPLSRDRASPNARLLYDLAVTAHAQVQQASEAVAREILVQRIARPKRCLGWRPYRREPRRAPLFRDVQMAQTRKPGFSQASFGAASHCRPLVTLVFRPAAITPPIKHPASDAFYEDIPNEQPRCSAKQVFKHGPSVPLGDTGAGPLGFGLRQNICDSAVTLRPGGGRTPPIHALGQITTDRKVGSWRPVGARVVTVPRAPHAAYPWTDCRYQPGTATATRP